MQKLFLTSVFSKVGDKIWELTPKREGLNVAFITTAADTYDTKPWLEEDRQKFVDLDFIVEDYDIKNKSEEEIYSDLKDKDIIFVSGGNVFYLLYHVNQSGFDKVIRRFLDEGKLYVGSSAGSVLVGPTVEPMKSLDNAEQAPKLQFFKGLELVDFVILPHYGKEKYEERYQDIIKEWSSKVKLLTLTDTQVIIVEGPDHRVV